MQPNQLKPANTGAAGERGGDVMIEGLERIVAEHPFFAGLPQDAIELVAGCAKNVRFDAGQYLFRTGETADEFYLIRRGRVALEVSAPGRGAVAFETMSEGEIVGHAWLAPPYRRTSDAKALELVRAISLDARCLRGKCDADHHVGYALMLRLVPVLVQRLYATRLQMLDVYASPR
jgi:CRP/FNR family transcriptional regulator, cyclic AMP receptor protein